MKILGFFFARAQAAGETVAELNRDAELQTLDVETAPLVVDGEEGTILAASVGESGEQRLVAIVLRNGGRVIANVPEAWVSVR